MASRTAERARGSETEVALLASIVDSSDNAIVSETLDGMITTWNHAAEQMYGYTAKEIVGKSITLLMPEGSTEMVDILGKIREGERVYHYQTSRLRKDGTAVPISLTVSPIYDNAGAIVGASSIARDITEQVRTDALLRASSEYARSLIEASLDPLVTISLEGKITDVNEATTKVTGVERGRLIGTDFSDCFTDPLKAREGYQRAFAEGSVTDYPLTIRHRDGALTDVLYNASVYRDAAGNVLGVFAAARDVTAQQQAEKEIRQLNAELEDRVRRRTEDLERSNRNLGAFTYSVAHDLRSPLRAMSGFSHALLERYGERLDEPGRGYAQRVRDASVRMATLIDDLLLLSRMSRAEVDRDLVDLSAIVRAIAADLQAQEPGRRATFEVEDGILAPVDRELFRTVLQNLLHNAWKFTAKREEARIQFGAVRAQEGKTAFFVRDNGVGFDQAYADKLFEPFQRLHSEDEYPGAGIGLASARQVVERHGGSIWGEGAVDQGATFYVTIATGEDE